MIIVTGGSGKAGRACITELLAHNYEVASVDLVRPPDVPVPFSRVELTDFGQTIEAFSQIDDRIRNVTAIVHLAAIPAPGLATNSVTFATNTISTYNVFEAARQLEIKNVVWVSSEIVRPPPPLAKPSWSSRLSRRCHQPAQCTDRLAVGLALRGERDGVAR